MTAKRDSSFPSTSIGRAQGTHISRVASFETLSAHPLLSPAASPAASAAVPESHNTPKYVPYTPRHRVASPATTTIGTTVDSSAPTSSQQQHGAATTKLQLMNLKAVVQNVGLDTTSIGWAMLEKIVYESDHSAEWTEIWNTITAGKASLLLPLEQASTHEKITPDFVKDHVVLCNGPSRDYVPIITLSGFRGILVDETLTFRSSLFPASKTFQDILGTFSRPSALTSLPPLTIPPTLSNPYPSLSVHSYIPALPLPPRAAGLNKPPLPPRPNSRSTTQSSSRLTNTFTSLFGKANSTTPLGSNTTSAPSSPDTEHAIEISAFTTDRRITGKDLGKAINAALKCEVQEAISDLPLWVIDRVHDFTRDMYPLVKPPKNTPSTTGGKSLTAPYIMNMLQESPAVASERFQNFYGMLEQDLRLGGSTRHSEGRGDEVDDNQEKLELASESRIREILEAVERTVCSIFYDRIYLQSTSDDVSHDEALSSRIAALNMLDLGLEHLDVHVEGAGPELDLVVKACGDIECTLEELTQLDSSSPSPADKSRILVEAHKIVVDGLSSLPPIRLKSEEESNERKALALDKKKLDGSSTLLTSPEPSAPLLFQQSPSAHSHLNIKSPSESIPGLHIPEDEEDTTASTSPLASPPAALPPVPTSPPPPQLSSPVPDPPPKSTPVSGDILLPLLIFSVVKANPPHLVSHLLYTQRFRNQSVGGEESYCLINLMAVAEFLENVDLAALGLADSQNKVLSASALTPIPINRTPISSTSASAPDGPGSLRGRVEQQVDAIAGSANKVISGVVGSSFGVLRLLLPGSQDAAAASNTTGTTEAGAAQSAPAPWNSVRPGFGLLGRDTGFSIAASIAASLPGASARAKAAQSGSEETGQPLLAVSRPPSVRIGEDGKEIEGIEDEEASGGEEEEGDGHEGGDDTGEVEHDSRSIRSFESMLNGKPRERRGGTRKSLSDRLAHMSGLTRLQSKELESPPKGWSPQSRQSSLHPIVPSARVDSLGWSRPQSPTSLRIAPPTQRFLECAEEDIRVSEVAELLREYRRVVMGLRAFGGFDE